MRKSISLGSIVLLAIFRKGKKQLFLLEFYNFIYAIHHDSVLKA